MAASPHELGGHHDPCFPRAARLSGSHSVPVRHWREEESKMLISFPTNVDQHFRENVGGNLLKKCWIQHFLYINVSVFLS
jgi:hypothetical protein